MTLPDYQIQCQKCGRVMLKSRWGVHRQACDRKGPAGY